MSKDLFGFENQGKNYEDFRPSYPQQIIDDIHGDIQMKGRFLDVATGTGQILFRVAPFFNLSVGTDISAKMIESARDKNTSQNIKLIQTQCMDTIFDYAKFNLVTVAEALHWFPVQDFIKLAAQSLLRSDGKLVVIGYYRKGIQSASENPLIGDVYNQYFQTITECCQFDQSDLKNQYPEPKYNFKTHFYSVQKKCIDYKLTMEVQNFLRYIKTYSMYNLYRQKYPDKPDPVDIVKQKLQGHSEIILVSRYFTYSCRDPLQK